MSIAERCRDAMLAQGLIPTAENLVRAAGISLEEAKMVLDMDCTPSLVQLLARVARSLKVRMIWLSCGLTVPHVTEVMRPEEIELLDTFSELSPKQARRLIIRGKRLAKR